MTITLYYTFRDENNNIIVRDFPYRVSENLQDIIEYKFYEKFGKPYNELEGCLENNIESFVKDLSNKWWYNALDTFSIYNDMKFKEWLSNKYYESAFSEAKSHVYHIDDYINDFDKDQLSLFDFEEDNKNE